MRWGKPRKNKKIRNPKYFLNESLSEQDIGSGLKAISALLYSELVSGPTDSARLQAVVQDIKTAKLGSNIGAIDGYMLTGIFKRWRDRVNKAIGSVSCNMSGNIGLCTAASKGLLQDAIIVGPTTGIRDFVKKLGFKDAMTASFSSASVAAQAAEELNKVPEKVAKYFVQQYGNEFYVIAKFSQSDPGKYRRSSAGGILKK